MALSNRERVGRVMEALKIGQSGSARFWENRLISAKGADPNAIYATKCRGLGEWREVQVVEHTGKDGTELAGNSKADLAVAMLELLKDAGLAAKDITSLIGDAADAKVIDHNDQE